MTFVFSCAALRAGQQVILAWDPLPDPSIGGYMVFYGNAATPSGSTLDSGTNTTATITGLASSVIYYFSVAAYESSADVVGDLSNWVMFLNLPPSLTNIAGTTATFSVADNGDGAAFQWLKNGVPIPNGTNGTLVLSNVVDADAAKYSVVASNWMGVVTSSATSLTVVDAPVILTNPVGVTVYSGSLATFSVVALGTSLRYQWLKNGVLMPGATNATLVLANVQLADAAPYKVIVSNAFGSVTTKQVSLSVIVKPAITNQPASLTLAPGQPASFSVGATGTATLRYQWYFKGAPIPGFGAQAPSLFFASATASNAGPYFAVVNNNYGTVTSAVATLTILASNLITTQPANQTVVAGQSASFSVGTGTGTFSFQWRFNGVNISGATSSTLALANLQASQGGNYSVLVANVTGSVVSSNAVLTVYVPPAITNQPASLTVTQGQAAAFSVAAAGTPTPGYQWYFNGTTLGSGAQTRVLPLNAVTASNAGSYFAVVANSYGAATSAVATLTVLVPAIITNQPASQAVIAGQSATFSVGADGTAPFSYQWSFNGANLPGATSSTLTLTGVQASQAGNYAVLAANVAGLAASSNAVLTVVVPPVITSQPQSLTANPGSNIVFSVDANGSNPLSYQWNFNGTPIPGATAAAFSITGAATNNAGTYSVVITNLAGAVLSSNALLAINIPPFITSGVAASTNLAGTTNTFFVSAGGTAPLSYQWAFNSTPIPGATGGSFTLANIVPGQGGTYSVTVANPAGAVVSANTLTVALDLNPPTVTIAAPAANLVVYSNVLTATGTAVDDAQVTNVFASLNGGALLTPVTTNGWQNWSVALDGGLLPGTNTLVVQASDFSGNLSPVTAANTTSFLFSVPSVLTVRTNGLGTVSTNLDQQILLVGQNYTLTALPGPAQLFANWQVGTTSSTNPVLVFTMQTNLVIQANFLPMPIPLNLPGSYSGLFYQTSGVTVASSGLLSLAINGSGAATGQVFIANSALPVGNLAFDATGHAQTTISRYSQHLPNLGIDLQVDVTGGSDTISGTITSLDSAWAASYAGNRAVFSATNPTPNAGKYTFVLPPASGGPAGYTDAAFTVAANGAISLSGSLGDGKWFSGAAGLSLSKYGTWPLYLAPYMAGGSVLGWLTVSNAPGLLTNVTGTIVWTKLVNPNDNYYPKGFTNAISAIGSGYLPPSGSGKILALPVSTLTIYGGDLPLPLVNPISLTAQNVIQVAAPNPYNLVVAVTPGTGVVSGTFLHPVTGLTTSFSTVLLQNQNVSAGEFQSTNTTGAVLVQ